MIRQGRYTKKVTKVRQAKRSSKRGWRWFRNLSKPKKFLVITGPVLAFLILTPILTYLYYANDISDQERLMNRNNTGIVLTDRNGETIYSVGRAAHRKSLPLSEMSKSVKDAVIASEDKNFYEHEGFSITGIGRAVFSAGGAGGGSTLTQQLAKNTLLTDQQTFLRKYQELFIALAIEQRYSKEQILEMYLNSVYYGENSFGIEDAAKTYFGKAPKDLDLAESAMLIGVLPAPSAYSPVSGNPEYAKERQTTVLTRMVTNKYITDAEKQAALGEQLAYAPQDNTNNSEAPHFDEMVMQELYDKYGEETVTRAGYQVKTTLDLGLQRQLKTNIANQMGYIQRNGGSNAGGVAIDPTSGQVRALVGSADWNNPEWGKVNMGTTARQPGSSFKPIYYAGALADGVINPATILHDKKTDFGGYVPLNANKNSFRGDVTVRSAISLSLNIPSVEVMQKYGIDNSIETAKKLGITTLDANKSYGLSLALGTAEIPLLQMTNAYAAFANQGQQYPTTTIASINNKFNSTIFTANEKPKTAISAEGAFLISNILSDNTARAPIFGSSLTVPGRTAAVKTGTTDDSRDAWTIGYTPQLAVGVWVGNNNNVIMKNGGSGMAGPIWVNTMKQALAGVQNTPFTVPSGVIQKPICYGSGGLASVSGTNTYNEYFLASALPTTTCNTQTKQQEPEKQPEEEPNTNTNNQQNNDSSNNDSNNDTNNNGQNNGNNNSGTGNGNGSGPGTGTGGGTITPPITTP
jgi:1A family penicillin-binding protein